MEKYAIPRGELSVWSRGAGNSILLVHGFPFDHAMWVPSGERLAAKFRVIAPDLRGFGKSVREESDGVKPAGVVMATIDSYADDLAGLLDTLKIEKTILCGLSMGGYIAMRFLRRHPEKLAGLILCDTKTTADSPAEAQKRLNLAVTVFQTGTGPLPDAMIPNLLAAETLENAPETIAALREMILRQKPAGIAAAARAMAIRPDTTDLLESVSVPALVLRGTEDKLSSAPVMRGIAEKIPNASYVEIPAAGHIPPLERPEAFANALLRWPQSDTKID